MAEFRLAYGETSRTLCLPESLEVCEVLPPTLPACADPLAEVARALDHPIESPPLREVARSARWVSIIVPDRTRWVPVEWLLHPLLARLSAAGLTPSRIRVVIARGIHPPSPRSVVEALLGDEVMRVLRPVQSAPMTPDQNVEIFSDAALGPIRIHRLVAESDLVLLTGMLAPHHLAGFGGGPKALVPGVAERDTVHAVHRLTLDAVVRPSGAVRAAPAAGNPFREALLRLAERFGRTWLLNLLPAGEGALSSAVAGALRPAHETGIARWLPLVEQPERELADLVILGTPPPRHVDLIQAHKGLLAAASRARTGAPILWLAPAPAGVGHPDLLPYFETRSLSQHLMALRERFHPYGLTAYSLRRLASDHPIVVVSEVSRDILRPMGFLPAPTPQKGLDFALREAVNAGRPAENALLLPMGLP